MTPEELIKQRKQRELLAKAAQAKTTAPADAEKLVSDATKENLKTAGRLAASFGKALADKTKQAASVAAEGARGASVGPSCGRGEGTQEAEAAENARLRPSAPKRWSSKKRLPSPSRGWLSRARSNRFRSRSARAGC